MQKKNLHTIGLSLEDCQAWLNALKSVKILFGCILRTPFLAKKFSRKKCVLYLANYCTQDNGHHLTEPLHHVFDGSEEFLLFFLRVGIVVSQIRVSAVLLQCKIHNNMSKLVSIQKWFIWTKLTIKPILQKKKYLWVTYYKVSFLTHTFFSAKIWKCEALVIHRNKILFHFFFKPWFWILQENDCWYRMLCKLHESKLNLLCPNTLFLILFLHIKRNVSSQCL